ncbi:tetratricopeptide repeat protein [Pyruvatibacter sp.]|uniref:tetratricopeptide repeat protein n=1 Tax=Pyruvatibacter sp. TaxID=1981328 RepID=UPI003263AA7E
MSPSEKRRARIKTSLVLTAFMVFGAVGIWFATKEMWVPDLSVMRAQTLTDEQADSIPTKTMADFKSYPFIHRAYGLMADGQYVEAEIYLARARATNPDRAQVWIISSQAAIQSGRTAQAAEFASEAAARDATSGRAILYRAIARDVAGEVVAARVDYAAALAAGGLTQAERELAQKTLGE